MSAYHYKPLPSPDTYIRLIELPPGKNEGTVSCSITQYLLKESPVYVTVSYSWGRKEDTSAIEVFDGDEAATGDQAGVKLLTVPANLSKFLLRSRANRKGVKRTFWADAICINQADEQEKARQVKLMREIYRRSKLTVVWLGNDHPDIERGIAFAKTLYAKAQGQAAGKNGTLARVLPYFPGFTAMKAIFGRDWRAFFLLLENSWFTRAWVVQEVSMATKVWVLGGNREGLIPWHELVGAIWHTWVHETWILEFFEYSQISVIYILLSQNEIQQGARRSHYEILARHRHAHATDERDHIFSFYGLACHESFKELGIEPRYDLPVEEVCTNIARLTLQRATNLDCLCIPRALRGPSMLRLPSWAPDWSHPALDSSTLLQLEAGDPKFWEVHRATGGSTYTPPPIDPVSLTLELSGYIIDTVRVQSDPWIRQPSHRQQTLRDQAALLMGNQRLVYDWFDTIGYWGRADEPYPLPGGALADGSALNGIKTESRSDAIWQTLVAGVGTLSQTPDAARAAWQGFLWRQRLLWWLPACGLAKSMAAHMVVVAVGHMLRFLGFANPEMAFRALTGPMLGRRGIVTDAGLIGLAPAGTAVDDRIVLLQGGRLPFVLRPHGERWELMGDCYVHGIMAGEAWGRKDLKPFLIV